MVALDSTNSHLHALCCSFSLILDRVSKRWISDEVCSVEMVVKKVGGNFYVSVSTNL